MRLVVLIVIGCVVASAEPKAADPGTPYMEKAAELRKAGDKKAALAEVKRALAIRERTFGKDAIVVAQTLAWIGNDEFAAGNADGAYAAYDRARTIREAKNPSDPELATIYQSLGTLRFQRGDLVKAKEWGERAVALLERLYGPDDPRLANPLVVLANIATDGDPAKAESYYQRALKVLKPDDIGRAIALNGLAGVLFARGKYAEAEAQYRDALVVLDHVAPKNTDRGLLLTSIAASLTSRGEYEKALVELERAAETNRERLPPDHLLVGNTLGELAAVHGYMGNYAKAIPMMEESLRIRRAKQDPESVAIATAENNLGLMYDEVKNTTKAIEYLERAQSKYRKQLGDQHPNVAIGYVNLGRIYGAIGNGKKARELLEQAMAILERDEGSALRVADASNILAANEEDDGNLGRARELFERALAIRTKVLGPDHQHTALSLSSLGTFHANRGDLATAEKLYTDAVATVARSQAPNHPVAFEARANLAAVRWQRGDRAGAEQLLREALAKGEAIMGADNPRLADTVQRLGFLLAVANRDDEALRLRERGLAMRDRALALRLAVGSEAQKLEATFQIASELDAAISLHVLYRPQSRELAALGFTGVLRRKGRVLDAMTDQLAKLRTREADRPLVEELAATRARLSSLIVDGPKADAAQYQAKLREVSGRLETLETEMGKRTGDVGDRAATFADLQHGLPAGSALVEFVRWQPSRPDKFARERAPARYIAYVVTEAGLDWRDLGEAAAIEQAVARLRAVLADPASRDVAQLARTLDELVMRPLRPLFGDRRALLIAPDGSLALVPFAAMLDERGRFLVEDYQFTYLNSARDLLRPHASGEARQPPLLVGDPDFGAVRARAGDLADARFAPLPGTTAELAALAKLVPRARLVTGPSATEAELQHAAGPEILHVATHGFFLADEDLQRRGSRGLVRVKKDGTKAPGGNPLLRSGLALAGANGEGTGTDDGVMTALEVSSLDLRGTRLVVLSACDTGVGEIHNGNGVFGLRRALVTAGAETQVMSLWKVDDLATRELMERYYAEIQRGAGRSLGMRTAQLALARTSGREHPYYWASFIVSGDWRGMNGQPALLPVARKPHGCGCQGGGSPSVVLALVVLGVVLRRRHERRV